VVSDAIYLCVCVCEQGISNVDNEAAFRFPIAFQCVFAICLACGISMLPESPRWLACNGKEEGTKMVLSKLIDTHAYKDNKPNDFEIIKADAVDKQYDEIMEAISFEESQGDPTWKEMFDFSGLNIGKRTLLAMGIQAMQQLTAINAVAYYQVLIYQEASLSLNSALLMAGTNGT
jgi:hypothetical protein